MTTEEAGRKGGKSTSKAKSDAARNNGKAPVKEGSRPRGRPRKVVEQKDEGVRE